jgi:hypothetical protein
MSWKQKYEDNSMLKIECMIPLLINAEYSEQLKEALDEMDVKEYCRLTGFKQKEAKEFFEDGLDAQMLIEKHYGKFLCKVATPKMDKHNMFSWGHTVLDTIIAKDMDDLVEQGLEFVEKYGKEKK